MIAFAALVVGILNSKNNKK
ncbi:hypothetical protein [Listeria booriae]|nr:hypothetical protein [Listeria booriae]